MKRNRLWYGGLAVSVLLLGLASRQIFGTIAFVRTYLGDGLWALMIFFGIATVLNRQPTKSVALLAMLFSFGIECSQLYHVQWINTLRSTRLGGLVLGYGFLWTDLLCYSIGILSGSLIDYQLNVSGYQRKR